jgi:uncharacterized protein
VSAGRLRILAVVAGLALAACGGERTGPRQQDYAAEIASARGAKDDMLAVPAQSPIPAERRSAFLPLAYFPVDRSYVVPAELEPASRRTTVEMPTSTGERRSMERVGTLGFMLMGQSASLGAFIESGTADVNRLFVPFTDATSGTETYSGGRYLDLERTRTGIYVIDFNRAYHPYCYYNPTFDCPYPPAENRLAMPVRAGERLKVPASTGG